MAPHRHRLLVIDDDADCRKAISALLTTEGFEFATAIDGQDALAQLGNGVAPCVILLDININVPGMDGGAFRNAQAGDAHGVDIPVIALAGDSHTEEKARKLRVRDYLLKPVNPERLLYLLALHCHR